MKKEEYKVLCQYKKARFDYEILDTYEAGLVLFGTEIKSLRQHGGSLNDCYCEIKDGEVFVVGFQINKYLQGNIFNHDPLRKKKLLLNKHEILKLKMKKTEDGYTIVPLRVYLKEGLAKMEIGIAKGLKNYDKRDVIKKRDEMKEIRKGGLKYE